MVFGLFLLLTAVTGLLWAYAPYLYWSPGYMEKKTAFPSPPFSEAAFSFPEAIGVLQDREGRKIEAESILLRKDFGRLVYEIEYRGPEGRRKRCLIESLIRSGSTP